MTSFPAQSIVAPLARTLSLLLTMTAFSDLVFPSSIKAFHQGDHLTGNGSIWQTINENGVNKPDFDDPGTWTVNPTASGTVTIYEFAGGGWTQINGSFTLAQVSGDGGSGEITSSGARIRGVPVSSTDTTDGTTGRSGELPNR